MFVDYKNIYNYHKFIVIVKKICRSQAMVHGYFKIDSILYPILHKYVCIKP